MGHRERNGESSAMDDFSPEIWESLRSALVLTPAPPLLEWLRTIHPDYDHTAVTREPIVIISPELPRASDREAWMQQHHVEILGEALALLADESDWPADRSLGTLTAWFHCAWAPVAVDMSGRDLLPSVSCGPVSLRSLTSAFETVKPGGGFFIDVTTGETVTFTADELDTLVEHDAHGPDPDDAAFSKRAALYHSESLVELLAPEDADTESMMATFASTVSSDTIRQKLFDALDSKKPVRRFLETVDIAGLRRAWLAFKTDTIAAAIRDELDHFRIPYTDDLAEDAPPT